MRRKKKPLIGVTTSVSGGGVMWHCMRLGIFLAGGRAMRITAQSPNLYEQCAGYLISGGVDIDPACYGQKNIASFKTEPERDSIEELVILHALERKKPLMGVCRGAQMINVVMGGTLHQNVQDIYPDFLPSTTVVQKVFSRRPVDIGEDGKLASIFGGATRIHVNSIHHQAINTLGYGLTVTARDRHGIIQAIESLDSKQSILGIQWHPEFMLYRWGQRQLFRQMVKVCKSF